MKLQALGFDWDSGNKHKCRKHGLALKDIEDFFRQTGLFVMPDIQHSQSEERYIAYGPSSKGRPMLVAFAFRTRDAETLIRPISARYMHKKEAKEYEEKAPKFKSDKEAEEFLEQDLTDYIDPRKAQQVTFEFLPKTEKVNLRFPPELLTEVRKKASKQGISYQKYIRRAVEESLTTQ